MLPDTVEPLRIFSEGVKFLEIDIDDEVIAPNKVESTLIAPKVLVKLLIDGSIAVAELYDVAVFISDNCFPISLKFKPIKEFGDNEISALCILTPVKTPYFAISV